MDQGIDHLVSLSPEKIPPAYAYPKYPPCVVINIIRLSNLSNLDQNVFSLKHTMIPVEDFTGPTISEIQKFIEITDEARKEGEVGNFPLLSPHV